MNIEKLFDKVEFQRLLFLTYLGDWIINAHRSADSKTEYTDVLRKMLGLAQQMGLDQYVTWERESRRIGVSCELEDECREFLSEYEDQFFIEELAERLRKIDLEALIRYQSNDPDIF